MSDLMLDVDQAGELKAAFRRSDWTNGQIKRLCEGDILFRIRQVLENKAEIVMKKVEEAVVVILTLVKTITTPAIAGKKTADCFTNKSRYYYRDNNLDNWLPKDQPAQAESKFSVQKLAHSATFKQAVESFLGVNGDIETLAKALKDRGAITTLPTIESLIERQEASKDVGLLTDIWASFFFVENKDGGVSVVYASRCGRLWHVSVYRLGRVYVWFAAYRFFFRN